MDRLLLLYKKKMSREEEEDRNSLQNICNYIINYYIYIFEYLNIGNCLIWSFT